MIRFEIQCKYLKIYNLKKGCSKDEDAEEYLLSDDFAKEILTKYFHRVIMGGDYYVYADAVKRIESFQFNKNREQRLIAALKHVNTSRGIVKAKDKLLPEMSIIFSQALRELVDIGINPVTIPRDWGHKRIPSLLNAASGIPIQATHSIGTN